MRTLLSFIIFSLFSGLSSPIFAAAGSATTTIAPMLQNVLSGVVNVKAFNKDPELQHPLRQPLPEDPDQPNDPDKIASLASGVIVDEKHGFILTNSHVIRSTKQVVVTLSDGRHYHAKVIGSDPASDIAILQIRAKQLRAIPMADSRQLKAGDFVAAIGNPFGLNQTVTSGIVSATGRSALGIENYENFIQTDASINPGNSGGALVNMKGELIGINTAIIAPHQGSVGIGFAIPSNMAKSVMNQVLRYGNVKRGSLGVFAQSMTPELARAFQLDETEKGAVITRIMPHTPAEAVGLQAGDIITAMDHETINNAADVINKIGLLRVNSNVSVQVLRNHKTFNFRAKLTDTQARHKKEKRDHPFLLGLGMENFDAVSPIHGKMKGVLIVNVEDESNAWHSDVRPGDVIVAANHQPVGNIAELEKIAAAAKDSLLVNILRGPGALFLVINRVP